MHKLAGYYCTLLSVLWNCWFGDRKGNPSVTEACTNYTPWFSLRIRDKQIYVTQVHVLIIKKVRV